MLRSVLRTPSASALRQLYHNRPHGLVGSRYFSSESKVESEEQDPNSTASNEIPTNGSPPNGNSTEQLAKELEEKNTEIADLNDRTLRVLAEMENVRMIARRDVDNAKKYAITPFAKAILSVADNLGLALQAVPQETLDADDADPQLKGLFTGVGATEAELLKVFAQHGIEKYGTVGDKFDPNKYQAMFEAPMPDSEPGTVISVTKAGYTIGDRILRPAEVGVSKA